MHGYTEKILKYAANQTYTGRLENPDGVGEVGLSGQSSGNRLAVRFTLKLDDDQIEKIRFQVFGCGYTIAACTAAAELSEGQSLQKIQQYTPLQIEKLLGGLPEERNYCAKVASQALQAAVISAQNGANPVSTELQPEQKEEHRPRIDRNDPFYRALLETPVPPGIFFEDRQMFAGLLTLATQENKSFAATLGLNPADIDKIFAIYFPGFDPEQMRKTIPKNNSTATINHDILQILLSHVSRDQSGKLAHISELLAKIIAARAAQPGHLWVAMGFLERPQLTAAIRRHLPTLAIANNKGMRWKRYLFKQVCDLNDGVMCKSPNCDDCSDYGFCFTPEKD